MRLREARRIEMLSLLVLTAASVAFPGGSPSELAKSIAEATKSNVVIEAGPSESLKPFNYEPANLDEMARAILKATDLKQAPGEDRIFYHPWLPGWHFQSATIQRFLNDSTRASQSGSLPKNSLSEGKVTIHARPRTGILVSNLEGLKFAKPLSVDRFFMQYGLNVWVTDMPERDFLNYVCKAIGGRLKPTKEGWTLIPTGQEMQRRALASYDRVKKEAGYQKLPPTEKAELELSRSAVSTATSSQLEELYGDEGKPIRMEIGPTSRAAVTQMLRAMMEEQAAAQTFGPPQETTPGAPKPEDRFKSIDRRVIGWVVLSRGFQAHAELATFDQLGRPGPPMRLP